MAWRRLYQRRPSMQPVRLRLAPVPDGVPAAAPFHYGRRALRTGRGMSTSNSAAPRTLGPGMVFAALFALVQRVPANLLRWILVLGRAPRARLPRRPGGVWLGI